MTDQELMKLHELAGRLKARLTILDSDIMFTERLKASLVTDNYNGYATGKVEAYEEWQRDTGRLHAAISLLIEEGESE